MRYSGIGRVVGMFAASFVADAASAASKLSVNPPADYTVTSVAPTGSYTEAVDVSSSKDTEAGCEIGFQPSAPGRQANQDMLNRTAATPQFGEILRNSLSPAYDIAQIRQMNLGDVHGFLVAGRPRGAPQQVQSRLYVFETPAGRTTVACVASAGQMAKRAPDFDAVARGVQLPR